MSAHDIALGEYLDVTPAWEHTPIARRRVYLIVVVLSVTFALALFAAGLTGTLTLFMGAMPATLPMLTAALLLLLPAYVMIVTGEPLARWRRIYAASGRLDIVVGPKVISFTRDDWVLKPDPTAGTRFPPNSAWLTLRSVQPFRIQRIAVDVRAHEQVIALWNRDDIAPPFGRENDR